MPCVDETLPPSMVHVQEFPEKINISLNLNSHFTDNGFCYSSASVSIWIVSVACHVQYQYDWLEDWNSPVCSGKEQIAEKGRNVVACGRNNECSPQLTCVKPFTCMIYMYDLIIFTPQKSSVIN